jgi:hypothetical protein
MQAKTSKDILPVKTHQKLRVKNAEIPCLGSDRD